MNYKHLLCSDKFAAINRFFQRNNYKGKSSNSHIRYVCRMSVYTNSSYLQRGRIYTLLWRIHGVYATYTTHLKHMLLIRLAMRMQLDMTERCKRTLSCKWTIFIEENICTAVLWRCLRLHNRIYLLSEIKIIKNKNLFQFKQYNYYFLSV